MLEDGVSKTPITTVWHLLISALTFENPRFQAVGFLFDEVRGCCEVAE